MRALRYFQRAVEEDPDFALAHTGIAESYLHLYAYTLATEEEALELAKESALTALDIDDSLGEAYSCLGHLMGFFEWKWEEAERDFKKAIELSPSNATAHHWYALYLLCQARLDESLEEYKTAAELDPLSHVIQVGLGRLYLNSYEYNKALQVFNRVVEVSPNFPNVNRQLGFTYFNMDRYEEALAFFTKSFELILNTGLSPESLRILIQELSADRDALTKFKGLMEEFGRATKSLDELQDEMEHLVKDSEELLRFRQEMYGLFRKNLRLPYSGIIDAREGRTAEARRILVMNDLISSWGSWGRSTMISYDLAKLCLALGEIDKCFSYLQDAVEYRNHNINYIITDPYFESVRSHPRFKAILRQMNLE